MKRKKNVHQLHSHPAELWSSTWKEKRDVSIFRTHKHIYYVGLSVFVWKSVEYFFHLILSQLKEMMRNKKYIWIKGMTFTRHILPGTTESSNLLRMIVSDDPFTSYKYTMSLGDYCACCQRLFFLTKSVVSYRDASKQIYV